MTRIKISVIKNNDDKDDAIMKMKNIMQVMMLVDNDEDEFE